MDEDDENYKWLCGLKYATELGFTHAEFQEAIKRIKAPDVANANQLLVALIDVSIQDETRTTSSSSSNNLSLDENIGNTNTNSNRNNINNVNAGTCCAPNNQDVADSVGTGFATSASTTQTTLSLKKVYIDGSNVARAHGKDTIFSWLGIKLCVDWFVRRQHRVKVFVPCDKCQQADEAIFKYLNDLDAIVQTPSGCNDDLFIIEAARHNNGVIVSNDLFRDEKRFNNEMQQFIYLHRLPYVFVEDLFIPAPDPLGRTGPTLNEFLQNLPAQRKNKLSRARSHQNSQANPKSALCRTTSHR